ncbi:MAG: hypothetical protein R3A80_10620 [Bdellovibrionota bacterium]
MKLSAFELKKLPLFLVIPSFMFLSTCKNSSSSAAAGVSVEEVNIYQTDNSYGNAVIGNRTNSNSFCEDTYTTNQVAWGISCTNFVSLLGYSTDNGIVDLPTNYGVPTDVPFVSLDDVEIASNWSDLIDDRDITMEGTGMTGNLVWTGFNSNGVAEVNCLDWISSSGGEVGKASQINAAVTPGSWNSGVASNCSIGTSLPILCLCW